MIQERVYERARPIPACGVRHHALLFVHDRHVFVFVDDVQRNVLGRDVGGNVVFPFNVNLVARAHFCRKFDAVSVQHNF